jgi:hypothetical protein
MDSSETLGISSDSILYDDRAVVASLSRESSHCFTAIAAGVLPNQYVLAEKDSLLFVRCDPSGLHELQTTKISQVCYLLDIGYGTSFEIAGLYLFLYILHSIVLSSFFIHFDII